MAARKSQGRGLKSVRGVVQAPIRMRAEIAASMVISLLVSGCSGGGSGDPFPDGSNTSDDPGPSGSNNPGNRSLVPDLWKGEQARILLETDFTHSGLETGLIIPDEEKVLQGTKWLNVTVSLTSSPPAGSNFRFNFTAANDAWREWAIESGTTESTDVAEEMNDLATYRQTRWKFFLRTDVDDTLTEESITGNVRIEIARDAGDLPFEPIRPDLWENNTRVVHFDKEGELFEVPDGSGHVVSPDTQPPDFLESAAPVPWNTTAVRVLFMYNSSTPPESHYSPLLNWRGADTPSGYEQSGVAPTQVNRRSVDGSFEWVIQVDPRMWDHPWTSTSRWAFLFAWSGQFGQGAWMDGDYHLLVESVR